MSTKQVVRKDFLIQVLQAVILIAFGIIIAVCGPSAAIDTWFGIGFLVGGVMLLVLAIVKLAKIGLLPFPETFLSVALVTLGIALLAKGLSFGVLVPIFVYLVLALGIALVFHGVYMLVKKQVAYGICEILAGALAIVFVSLYLCIPDFATAFWIVIGILVAVYGVFMLIFSLFKKN